MNAKKILCMVVALAMAVPVFGRKIHWNDKWDTRKKSIEILVPIDGNIDEETGEVTLNFLQDLGVVKISIVNDNREIIYEIILDTCQMSIWNFALDTSLEGNAYIKVENECGNSVYGRIL